MNQKGITLVGLIITVIVIVTIAGVCIYTGRDILEEARQTELETNILLIQAAGKTLYDRKTLGEEGAELVGTEIMYNDEEYYVLDKDNLDKLGVNIKAAQLDETITKNDLENNQSLYIINYETNDVKYLANIDLNNVYLTGLPSEYQRVEYIESTGTQYIDTGYKPSNLTKVEVEFMYNNLDGFVYGSRTSSSSNDSHAFIINASKQVYPQFNGQQTNVTSTYNQAETKYVLINSQAGAHINNVSIKSYATANFSSSYNMYIFGLNQAGSLESRTFKGKIYYFKIYNGNTLVRDFVPCYLKADMTKVGLYDRVYQKFYPNEAGTDTFGKGNDVQ